MLAWLVSNTGCGYRPSQSSDTMSTSMVQGDVEKLGARIAAIRTWAYVAQRRDWLADPADMAGRTRAGPPSGRSNKKGSLAAM